MANTEEFSLGEFSDVEEDLDSDVNSDTDDDQDDSEDDITVGSSWDRIFTPNPQIFQPPAETFRTDFEITSTSSPFAILQQLVTDEMITEVCRQTNAYSDEIKRSKPTAIPRWKSLTEKELWVFLGINLAMGISHKPNIKDYWSTNPILHSPFFSKNMSRNRFEDILRALHLHENAAVPSGNRNRFIKLGSFMDSLLQNCSSAIHPGEFLCLDETLMAFKGRLSFRQYNPQKRNRFGIKYFALIDRETDVLLAMLPYQGKSTDIPQSSVTELGFGGAAVMKLLEPYLNKGHKVVVDNYFNSPTLAAKLLQKKTYVLGTAQKRRKKMPAMPSKMKKGEVQTYSDGRILVERWLDRREVVMLNTFVPHSMKLTVSSNPSNTRHKPESVLIYNKKMGAVDEMDKAIKYYANMRKTYKWYKKVFFFLMDVAVYNAYRISNGIAHRKGPFKDFLLSIIKEIMEHNDYVHPMPGRPATVQSSANHCGMNHLPERLLTKSGKPARGSCSYCKGKKGDGPRSTTQFKCIACDVWLHIETEKPCFRLFHSARTQGSKEIRRTLADVTNTFSLDLTSSSQVLDQNLEAQRTSRWIDPINSYSSSASTFVPARVSTPNRQPNSTFVEDENSEPADHFYPTISTASLEFY